MAKGEFGGRHRVLPLAGLTVVERSGPGSTDPSRAAVAFAGLLAAQLGAHVVRVEPEGGDPLRRWPPHDAAGSTVHAFLTRFKTLAPSHAPAAGDMLLTDDAATLDGWGGAGSVFVHPLPTGEGGPVSELTLMARSGLLDIFGRAGEQPQPLPGHQIAYAAGTAAFDGLLSAHLSGLRGLEVAPVRVSLLDVALWVNWKHFMAGWQGREAGLKRKEEWTSLRCSDGYIALTFQDKDMAGLARLTGNDYFLSPDIATRSKRKAHIPQINAALEAWSRHHTRADIAERAKALRLPVGAVLSLPEVVQDAHMDHRGFFELCAQGRRFPRLPLFWNGGPAGRAAGAAAAPERIAGGARA